MKKIFGVMVVLIYLGSVHAQEIKDAKAKCSYVKKINSYDLKSQFLITYDEMEFLINRKYLSKFNRKDIDTLNFSKLSGPAKQAYLGTLANLLLKRKAFFYKINNRLIEQLIFCRYYFQKDLIYADFFMQRKYPDEDDKVLFRYSKFKVSLPNRLDN